MKQKINKIVLTLTFAVFFLLNGLQIDAQRSRYDEEISEELVTLGQEKLELIKSDLSGSETNEWAGVYSLTQGTTVSTILGWSESSGFFTRWYNCSRPWTERINYGSAEFSNNQLKIKPTLKKEEKSSHIITDEFTAVSWDKQHFLIPLNEFLRFAYAVHSNSESQIESFFLKNGDREKSRTGLPNLPKEFEKFLTMKAIKPKITAVKNADENSNSDDEITLDLGRADNIIKGMIFYYSDSSGDMSLMITDLQETTSKARIINISSNNEDKKMKPKIGRKFTSQKPENFFEY